jgi:hypothetical protein
LAWKDEGLPVTQMSIPKETAKRLGIEMIGSLGMVFLSPHCSYIVPAWLGTTKSDEPGGFRVLPDARSRNEVKSKTTLKPSLWSIRWSIPNTCDNYALLTTDCDSRTFVRPQLVRLSKRAAYKVRNGVPPQAN